MNTNNASDRDGSRPKRNFGGHPPPPPFSLSIKAHEYSALPGLVTSFTGPPLLLLYLSLYPYLPTPPPPPPCPFSMSHPSYPPPYASPPSVHIFCFLLPPSISPPPPSLPPCPFSPLIDPSCLQHFQKGLKSMYGDTQDQLISKALKISLNSKKMKKYMFAVIWVWFDTLLWLPGLVRNIWRRKLARHWRLMRWL